jgi:hypothetical protein
VLSSFLRTTRVQSAAWVCTPTCSLQQHQHGANATAHTNVSSPAVHHFLPFLMDHLACSGRPGSASRPPNAAAADVRRPAYSAPRSPMSPRSRLEAGSRLQHELQRLSRQRPGSRRLAVTVASAHGGKRRPGSICQGCTSSSIQRAGCWYEQARQHRGGIPAGRQSAGMHHRFNTSPTQVTTWRRRMRRPAPHRCPRARAPRQSRRPPGPDLRAGSRSVLTRG